jgi:hypothetical protein
MSARKGTMHEDQWVPPKTLRFHGADHSASTTAEVLVEHVFGDEYKISVSTKGLFRGPRPFRGKLEGHRIIGDYAADLGEGVTIEVAKIDGKPTAQFSVTEPAREPEECETYVFTLEAAANTVSGDSN